ncbi:hypothetical protein [Rhodovibrio sodomensis]|nr:hypothetical protein [Rhodovibrio sodomensis]
MHLYWPHIDQGGFDRLEQLAHNNAGQAQDPSFPVHPEGYGK